MDNFVKALNDGFVKNHHLSNESIGISKDIILEVFEEANNQIAKAGYNFKIGTSWFDIISNTIWISDTIRDKTFVLIQMILTNDLIFQHARYYKVLRTKEDIVDMVEYILQTPMVTELIITELTPKGK